MASWPLYRHGRGDRAGMRDSGATARTRRRAAAVSWRPRTAPEVVPTATSAGAPAVLLRVRGADVALLSPLEVGRLRGQLREAVLEAERAARVLDEHGEWRA